jgi:hypothetical protein
MQQTSLDSDGISPDSTANVKRMTSESQTVHHRTAKQTTLRRRHELTRTPDIDRRTSRKNESKHGNLHEKRNGYASRLRAGTPANPTNGDASVLLADIFKSKHVCKLHGKAELFCWCSSSKKWAHAPLCTMQLGACLLRGLRG